MKHIRFGAIGFVLLALLALSLPVMAQDDEDTEASDPTKFSLPVLMDGAVINETITDTITMRAYAFNATEGDLVTISMTQEEDSGLDPLLVLLGPAGEVIASDDDGGDMAFSSLMEDVEIPASGGYIILATTFSNIRAEMSTDVEDAEPVELLYELTLTGNTEPTDLEGYEEGRITYFRGELSYNTPFPNGFSSEEEPVYYFVMDGSEGDVIDIELTSEDFDTLLYLFNPEGSRIAVNDDDPEGSTLNSAIREIELPVDGQYLIMATSYGYHQIPDMGDDDVYEGGNFTITVTEAE